MDVSFVFYRVIDFQILQKRCDQKEKTLAAFEHNLNRINHHRVLFTPNRWMVNGMRTMNMDGIYHFHTQKSFNNLTQVLSKVQ